MYIFSRATTVDRHRQVEAIGKAVEIAALAGEINGVEIGVYISRYGEPMNNLRWSMRAGSQAELQEWNDKLLATPEYHAWVSANSGYFESAPQDFLWNVLSATLPEQPTRFYTVVTAAAAPGKIAQAVGWGVKAQQFVSEATGLGTAFSTSVFGEFATVGWLTAASSAADLDTLDAMQNSNATYHEMLVEASDYFLPGSARSGLLEKVN